MLLSLAAYQLLNPLPSPVRPIAGVERCASRSLPLPPRMNLDQDTLLPDPDDEALRVRLIELQREGEARGAAFLAVLVLTISWLFTIPPDIRRSHICGVQIAQKEETRDCTPAAAVWERVQEHYASCGGSDGPACVKLDLSVDPKSQASFSEFVRTLQSEATALR